MDGATPIVIVDTDEIIKSLQKATARKTNHQVNCYETDSTDEASN